MNTTPPVVSVIAKTMIIAFLNVTIIITGYSSYIAIYDRICKKGSYTRVQFSALRMCNSASVGPTALKFGGRPFLSLY